MNKEEIDSFVKRFKSLTDAISHSVAKKYTDRENMFPDLKYVSLAELIRLSDKFNRLCRAMGAGQKVGDQKLDNTLKGLAVYSILLMMELEKERNHVQ